PPRSTLLPYTTLFRSIHVRPIEMELLSRTNLLPAIVRQQAVVRPAFRVFDGRALPRESCDIGPDGQIQRRICGALFHKSILKSRSEEQRLNSSHVEIS